MKYMRVVLFMTIIAIFLTFSSSNAQFQPPPEQQEIPEVTDQELRVFIDASLKAQQIQTEAQMEMISIVEDEGLDVATYNRILEGMRMEQSAEEMDVTDSQLEKFSAASDQIEEIEEKMEERLITAIEDEGMKLERYQMVFTAIQMNPELQQKMQQMVQEAQMMQE